MHTQNAMIGGGFTPNQCQSLADSALNLTATGTIQADAKEFKSALSLFATVPANSGALLSRQAQPGDTMLVYNGGANTLKVYPQLGDSINGLAVNTPVSVSPNTPVILACHDSTKWSALFAPTQDVGPASNPTFADLTVTGRIGLRGTYNANPVAGDPAHAFDLQNDNSGLFAIQQTGYGSGNVNLHQRYARGTLALPTAIQLNDALGSIGYRGHDGGVFTQSAGAIICRAAENWDATHHGTFISFEVQAKAAGAAVARVAALVLNSDASITIGGSSDVILARDASNTLALRNGTNAQIAKIYNKFGTANEWLAIDWQTVPSTVMIITQQSGTGVSRGMLIGTTGSAAITFDTASTDRWQIQPAGHWVANTDNVLDFGSAGANRARTGYFGTSVISPILDSGAASAITFKTNTGTTQASILNTASAVNQLTLKGGTAGVGPILSVDGETNVSLQFSSKGSGGIDFETATASTFQVRISHTASAVNWVALTGGATTVGPTLSADGETNVDLRLAAKNTGVLRLLTAGADIQWGKALVALGGGAAPTVGTIGGTGPATAAQNSWMRVLDSGGAAFWVPAWK